MTLAPLAWVAVGCREPGPARPPGDGLAHSAVVEPHSAADPHSSTPPPDHTGAPVDDRDPSFLFEDVVVTELGLELSPAAIDALRVEPRTYVEGVFTYAGEVYDPVGVRLKGNGSFQPIDGKPSFKISFDEYVPDQEFHGLEKLVLNNMANDPSSMHERVAHRLFREAGVPDVRSGHAAVSVNGEVWGLYAVDENVDEDFLKGWWAEPDGSMWEIFDADFTTEGVALFEHEEGVDDRSRLLPIGAALDTIEPGDWAAITPYLDEAAFLRFWAATAVVGQYDAYPYSFPGDDVHLYLDPADLQLDFIPHGCDETFEDPARPVTFVYGNLADACIADAACLQAFTAEVWAVQEVAERLDLRAYGDEIQLALAPWLGDDRRALHTIDDRRAAVAAFAEFVDTRPASLAGALGPRP